MYLAQLAAYVALSGLSTIETMSSVVMNIMPD